VARREEELNGPGGSPGRPTVPPTPVDWAKMSERFERDREAGLPPFGDRERPADFGERPGQAGPEAQREPGPSGAPDHGDQRSLAQDLLRGRGPLTPQPPARPPQPPQPPQPRGPQGAGATPIQTPPPPAPVAGQGPSTPPVQPGPPPPPQAPAGQARPVREATPTLLGRSEIDSFRGRWPDIKAAFVDDPRASVQEADQLVGELTQLVARRLGEERSRIEQEWSRGETSTEELRQALHRYQVLFDRLTSS